ncbi:Uma2 family endonuclease [Deinococcus sp.]|uniref:Uma2 family endonuclease n=1 Tax=Deinococcus sp. TaxID=47478 RepID=UPI003B5ACB39
MSDPAFRKITEEDYLRSEETSPIKHEYVDGFVYPLHGQAGASRVHNRIASNVQRIFLTATKGGPCWSYGSDMKIKLKGPEKTRYYFPDIVVVCDEDTAETYAETRPCLIVEILSQSTRQVDMTYKLSDYLSLPSLQGYLLVDSEQQAAELYKRLPGGWTTELVQDEVTLPCLNIPLNLSDIYAGVSL